jgi:Zn finger protein HypA/HybF involved in hydrogenase expression
MSLDFEDNFDDDVYEDSFYEEEEELGDEEEIAAEASTEEEEVTEVRIDVSFVCDDCDYRWDDSILQRKNEYEEVEEITDTVCPMCGSMNVTQI